MKIKRFKNINESVDFDRESCKRYFIKKMKECDLEPTPVEKYQVEFNYISGDQVKEVSFGFHVEKRRVIEYKKFYQKLEQFCKSINKDPNNSYCHQSQLNNGKKVETLCFYFSFEELKLIGEAGKFDIL